MFFFTKQHIIFQTMVQRSKYYSKTCLTIKQEAPNSLKEGYYSVKVMQKAPTEVFYYHISPNKKASPFKNAPLIFG